MYFTVATKESVMIEFILLGQAKDIFEELAFMTKLEEATGHVLLMYQPKIPNNNN